MGSQSFQSIVSWPLAFGSVARQQIRHKKVAKEIAHLMEANKQREGEERGAGVSVFPWRARPHDQTSFI